MSADPFHRIGTLSIAFVRLGGQGCSQMSAGGKAPDANLPLIDCELREWLRTQRTARAPSSIGTGNR